jgi:Ca-activated chloride channel family protein
VNVAFYWPKLLWLMAALPLVVLLYAWIVRRRRRAVAKVANLAMMREAAASVGRFRRWLPAALYLIAIALATLAIARPHATITVPSAQRTIILAMDVSGSMRAKDVAPSRLVAAQEAARTFVKSVPATTRIGVVAFAGTAAVVQQPTQNRDDVLAAIDRFQLQRGTAIGSGIIVSLATLFPGQGIQVTDVGQPRGMPRIPDSEKKEFTPVPAGSFESAAIILLTDGQRTAGPEVAQAAKMAAERGVRVFTVGIGTPTGEALSFEGMSMRVKLDEGALKQIANATRGDYYAGTSATELIKIYQSLNTKLVFERKDLEITALVAAAAAVFALIAAGLSMLWFNRIL